MKNNLTHILVDQFKVELYNIMSKYWIDTIASNVDSSAQPYGNMNITNMVLV